MNGPIIFVVLYMMFSPIITLAGNTAPNGLDPFCRDLLRYYALREARARASADRTSGLEPYDRPIRELETKLGLKEGSKPSPEYHFAPSGLDRSSEVPPGSPEDPEILRWESHIPALPIDRLVNQHITITLTDGKQISGRVTDIREMEGSGGEQFMVILDISRQAILLDKEAVQDLLN